MHVEGAAPGTAAEIEAVLRALPDWFGMESAIREYAAAAPGLDVFRALDADRLLGFLALRRHAPTAAEILVMGVLPDHHRRGIGRRLLEAAEAWLVRERVRFLQVKTLSPLCEHEPYARTRAFYEAHGFCVLEDVATLWGGENPCRIYVKVLPSTREG